MLKWIKKVKERNIRKIQQSIVTSNDESISPYIKLFETAYVAACTIIKITQEPRVLDAATMKLGNDMQFTKDVNVNLVFTEPIDNATYMEIMKEVEVRQKNNSDDAFREKYGDVQFVTLSNDEIQLEYSREYFKDVAIVVRYLVTIEPTKKIHSISFARSMFSSLPANFIKNEVMVYDVRMKKTEVQYIVLDTDDTHVSADYRKIYSTWAEAFEAIQNDHCVSRLKITSFTRA